MFFLATLTGAAQADGLVTEVKVRQSGDAVKIVIPANAAVQHRARTLDKSVVVDLFPAKLGSAIKADYAVNRGPVNKVHAQQLDESTVRITADTTSTPNYRLTQRPGNRGLVLDVSQSLSVPPRKMRANDKLVSLNLVNADLGYVIKLLVKKMGHSTYLGPGVEGAVTLKLQNAPVKTALEFVLKSQESNLCCQLVEPNTILVTDGDSLDTGFHCSFDSSKLPKDAIRREILLERAGPPRIIAFLESQYQNVRFTPHPTLNGFFVTASRSTLLEIVNRIPELDREPKQPEPVQTTLRLTCGDPSEIKALISVLVPDVSCRVDEGQSILVLEGSPAAIELATETIATLMEKYREETWFTHSRDDQPGSSPP